MSGAPLADNDTRSGPLPTLNERTSSLDLLRGLTVFATLLVIASRPVFEQLPSSWVRDTGLSAVCSPLWHGVNLASYLQPAFLVITGAAVFCSSQRRRSSGQSLRRIWGHAVLRAVALIALGVLLDGWRPSQDGIRFAGPLQQIGICSLVATLVATLNEWRLDILLLGMALVNSWFLHDMVPLDQLHPDPYADNHNIAVQVDSDWLPGRRLFGTWDQYGFASLLPAIALTLAGLLLARYLVFRQSRSWETDGVILLVGCLLVGESRILSRFMPVNEYLWTLPFFALSLGVVLIVAALCHVVAEDRSHAITMLLTGVGRNALVVTIGVRLIGPDAWPLELLPRDGLAIVANVVPVMTAVAQVSVLLVGSYHLSTGGRIIRL